jgi:tRNA pseudouridine55 synthase
MTIGKVVNGKLISSIVPLYKTEGETPLACMKRFQVAFPEYVGLPMTYAGRLDPMAHGLLLCLAGDTCKQKEKFLGFDKEYYFEILVGFSTDTHDLLGLLTETKETEIAHRIIQRTLDGFIGRQQQMYPAYSSKTVDGAPLHELARDGVLPVGGYPHRTVTVYSLDVLALDTIPGSSVKNSILKRLSRVVGDFRQEKICDRWKESINELISYQVITCRMKCSSGTYVRGIVRDLSKRLGVPLCTYSIYRPTVGSYSLSPEIKYSRSVI